MLEILWHPMTQRETKTHYILLYYNIFIMILKHYETLWNNYTVLSASTTTIVYATDM